MTANHLHQWDIQYLDPTRDVSFDNEGEEIPNQKSFGQKLMRHFVFGGEFMLMPTRKYLTRCKFKINWL